MADKRRKWIAVLFTAYGIIMLWLLFGQRMGQGGTGIYTERLMANMNLVPLETICRFIRVLGHSTDPEMRSHALINLAGNVIMFVPLGFFVPWIWERSQRLRPHFLIMVIMIMTVELLQMVTLLGSCDLDDVILNLVGTEMGFVLWKSMNRFGKENK